MVATMAEGLIRVNARSVVASVPRAERWVFDVAKPAGRPSFVDFVACLTQVNSTLLLRSSVHSFIEVGAVRMWSAFEGCLHPARGR